MRNRLPFLMVMAILFLLPGLNYGQADEPAIASSPVSISSNSGKHYADILLLTENSGINPYNEQNNVENDLSAAMPINNTLTTSASSGAGNEIRGAAFYPNPFTTSLEVNIPDEWLINKSELRLYTLLGAEVLKSALIKQLTSLETGNLPSGIYFYKLICNNKIVQSGRLVSQQ